MKNLEVVCFAWIFFCCYITGVQSTSCKKDEFQCFNNKCIKRSWRCDGGNDCGDGSDEKFCDQQLGCTYYYNGICQGCPQSPYRLLDCRNKRRCIPEKWWCDGVADCPDNSDEINCLTKMERLDNVNDAKRSALLWILQQRKETDNMGWDANSHRAVLALYFADDQFFSTGNFSGKQFTSELHIRLLSSLLKNKGNTLSSTELASYINALLVTCTNPRDFYGMDLVKTLREQSYSSETNFTNPFILLTLCNAEEKLNSNDITSLLDVIKPRSSYLFWTEIQALALMALTCVEKQSQNERSYATEIEEAAASLKDKQRSDGSFNALQTTALVMQALFASDGNDDDWDFEEAAKYLVKNQKINGSFGDFLTTYYIIPVLGTKSLLNVSMAKCAYKLKDVTATSEDVCCKKKDKITVNYSLWFGDQQEITQTMRLKVPGNMTFFDIMSLAAEKNCNYVFLWTSVSLKPYVYSISGTNNDPERGKFWQLHKAEKGETEVVVPLNQGLKELIPQDKDHIIMWYKSLDH